jgi:hypothetical protein
MLQPYAEKAVENKTLNAIAVKNWIESHTPEQIRAANMARITLKRKLKKKAATAKLHDDRMPKRSSSAQAHFFKDRYHSGDFAGVKAVEAMKVIVNEFKALPATERKVSINF